MTSLISEWARAATPPTTMTVSEWADAHRLLPETSAARGGRWKTATTPYLAGVMNSVHEAGVRTIAVMKAAQVGVSEALNNVLGYFIASDPSPMLLVHPTAQAAEAYSKERLGDMIRTTPALSAVVQDRRTAGAPESTLSLKMFPGGFLALGGANTPNTFARWSVRVAIGDDVDRFPPVVGDEGDPGELLVNRTTSFHDRLAIFASTPVMRGGRIDTAYARSDRRRFFVRCPACGRTDFIAWNDVAHFRVAFEERDPLTAHLRCADEDHGGCGARIEEPARRDLIARGEWRPTAEAKEPGLIGFHVPAMLSPWVSLPELVAKFLAARERGRESLKVFMTTSLAEPWEDRTQRMEAHPLYARREDYGDGVEVPANASALTAGVDVQADRFEMIAIAWGAAGERWVVDWRVIPGDPRKPEARAALLEALTRRVRNAATAPFEAAGAGRRARGWHAPTLGPNDVMLFSSSTLRNRSREAVRNNGFARDIIDKLVTNLVGGGIVPQSQAPDAAFRARVHELWGQWVDEADTSGVLDLYGLMSQVARAWLEAGEVFVRIRPRLPSDGLVVPLQLQLLEAESCPSEYNTITSTGAVVRRGIQFDAIGRRTAYWFYQQRPAFFSDLQRSSLVAIPARNLNGRLLVAHVFEPVRPNQIRGLPHLTQALIKLYEMDRFDDATLLRAQLQNLFAGFVKRPATLADASGNHLDPLTGKVVNLDDNGLPIIALEPGTFQELGPGEEVTFNDPPDAGAQYGEFMRVQLMGAATAAGLPYELLTGDLRQVSDRALRVILNEFRRKIEQRQHQIIAFQFCRPIWESWLTQAFASGALPIPKNYEKNPKAWERVEWVPPRWGYIHPVQDVEAERALVRSGFKSRSQVVKELGYDIEQLDREIAADAARADDLRLVFDSDPRKTGPSQTTAVPPDATPTPPPGASAQVIKRVIRDANGLISVVIEDQVPAVRVPKVRVQNYVEVSKPEKRTEE